MTRKFWQYVRNVNSNRTISLSNKSAWLHTCIPLLWKAGTDDRAGCGFLFCFLFNIGIKYIKTSNKQKRRKIYRKMHVQFKKKWSVTRHQYVRVLLFSIWRADHIISSPAVADLGILEPGARSRRRIIF